MDDLDWNLPAPETFDLWAGLPAEEFLPRDGDELLGPAEVVFHPPPPQPSPALDFTPGALAMADEDWYMESEPLPVPREVVWHVPGEPEPRQRKGRPPRPPKPILPLPGFDLKAKRARVEEAIGIPPCRFPTTTPPPPSPAPVLLYLADLSKLAMAMSHAHVEVGTGVTEEERARFPPVRMVTEVTMALIKSIPTLRLFLHVFPDNMRNTKRVLELAMAAVAVWIKMRHPSTHGETAQQGVIMLAPPVGAIRWLIRDRREFFYDVAEGTLPGYSRVPTPPSPPRTEWSFAPQPVPPPPQATLKRPRTRPVKDFVIIEVWSPVPNVDLCGLRARRPRIASRSRGSKPPLSTRSWPGVPSVASPTRRSPTGSAPFARDVKERVRQWTRTGSCHVRRRGLA